jgi:hypothetical protein
MRNVHKIFHPVRLNLNLERSEREEAKRQRRLAKIMRRSEKEVYLKKEEFING